MINVHILHDTPLELDHDKLLEKYKREQEKEMVNPNYRPNRYIEVCIGDLTAYKGLGICTFSRNVRSSVSCTIDDFYRDLVGYDIDGAGIYRLQVRKHTDNSVYLSGMYNALVIDLCYYPKKLAQDKPKSNAELKDFN